MLKKTERINYFVIFELLKGIKKIPARHIHPAGFVVLVTFREWRTYP